jgi:hypothetical protein
LTAPRSPYPPDPAEGATPPVDLRDVTDGRIEHGELANIRAFRSSLQRVELHLCRLTGAELAEASWQDVPTRSDRLPVCAARAGRLP